nr:hypothetical protein [Tanacetum cinerariifolium]
SRSRDLDVADVSTQPPPEQIDEGFTATTYLKVQENLKLTVEEHVILEEPSSSSGTLSSLQHLTKDLSFGDLLFSDKPSEANNDKATAETETESMVSVMIQQDMSSIPSITTQIFNLTSRPDDLEHIMANLIQENKRLEQRLDSHGVRLYTLEQLDIPHQVSKSIDEVVMDAVDWTMQALLRNRFRHLPEADMKEILHQLIWETDSYKTHKDHMQLYEALEKSMNRDHSEELSKDLAEARKKKKKSRESPKTPPGSPPHLPPPPPPPPLAGPSGASGSPRASRSLKVLPPPPPPPSTNQEGQSKGSTAPSSSKTAASAEYQTWMMTDIRLMSSISLTPVDLQMDDDMAPDEQAQLSDDEDIENAHILKVNLWQDWWKPLKEERPHTLEPAWSIMSFDVPTGDIAMFIDWFCKRRGIIELKPQDLEGPTFEIIEVYHPNMIHLRKGSRPALSISKMKATYYLDAGLEKMVPDQMWIEEECKYDIAAIAVRTHMRILNVVRIKVFSMYGYDYMKKIVLRRADLNEHVIAERDFKYLYPSDFEDLYMLNLQEDFQLGIESYQTQLNLTKPRWDAMGFEYKHNYTVIDTPRVVTFQDRYGVQMIMCFNEIHKFSDGMLQRIDEALDYRVKEFKINRMNPGLNTRFLTK